MKWFGSCHCANISSRNEKIGRTARSFRAVDRHAQIMAGMHAYTTYVMLIHATQTSTLWFCNVAKYLYCFRATGCCISHSVCAYKRKEHSAIR